MFDSGSTRPSTAETYETATGSSHLRVEADRRGPADIIIAAGMSEQRLGMALMRLESQWDRASAKVKTPTKAQIEVLAKTLEVEPEESEHAGKVRVQLEAGKVGYWTTADAAKRQAYEWHEHELKLALQQCKSLPEVRAALIFMAEERKILEPEQAVASAILWTLHHTCPVCEGRGKKSIRGTNRLSGLDCAECQGTGDTKIPYGGRGRRLVAIMADAKREAIVDLGSKFRHQQSKPVPRIGNDRSKCS